MYYCVCMCAQLMEGAIALTRRVYAGDEVASHRYDYEWLVEGVMKVRDRHAHPCSA